MKLVFCTYPVGFGGPLGSDADYKQVGELRTTSDGKQYVAWDNPPSQIQKPKNNVDGSGGFVPAANLDSRSIQADGTVQTRNQDTCGAFEQVVFDGSSLTSLPSDAAGYVTLAKATF